MKCRKIKFTQEGGYGEGYRLHRKPDDNRYIRYFTEVLPDGSTNGEYVGYDYLKNMPDGEYKMQGTAWTSAVKKAYRQNCINYREALRLEMIVDDFNIDPEEAEEFWEKMSPEEQKPYRIAASEVKCIPMEILMRETTPQNNKVDFSHRERKYYLESIPVDPIKVTPSRGPTPRIYRFIPKHTFL